MLQNILAILAKEEVVSEQRLAKTLNMSENALKPLMKMIVDRGHAELVVSGDCSGGCGCVIDQKTAYRFVSTQAKSLNSLHIINVH